jgi:hypothetical protein
MLVCVGAAASGCVGCAGLGGAAWLLNLWFVDMTSRFSGTKVLQNLDLVVGKKNRKPVVRGHDFPRNHLAVKAAREYQVLLAYQAGARSGSIQV